MSGPRGASRPLLLRPRGETTADVAQQVVVGSRRAGKGGGKGEGYPSTPPEKSGGHGGRMYEPKPRKRERERERERGIGYSSPYLPRREKRRVCPSSREAGRGRKRSLLLLGHISCTIVPKGRHGGDVRINYTNYYVYDTFTVVLQFHGSRLSRLTLKCSNLSVGVPGETAFQRGTRPDPPAAD